MFSHICCLKADILMCLLGNPICILNSNKWSLTSKCIVKGTGKTLEEQERKGWPLCRSADRKQQCSTIQFQPEIKNSGKMDLLPWAKGYNNRSRGKYFNFRSVVFETKHPLFWPKRCIIWNTAHSLFRNCALDNKLSISALFYLKQW